MICSKEDLHFGWANVMALKAFFAGGQALWSGNRISVVGNKLSANLSTFSILIWAKAIWWDRKGGSFRRGDRVSFGNLILKELRSPLNMGYRGFPNRRVIFAQA